MVDDAIDLVDDNNCVDAGGNVSYVSDDAVDMGDDNDDVDVDGNFDEHVHEGQHEPINRISHWYFPRPSVFKLSYRFC